MMDAEAFARLVALVEAHVTDPDERVRVLAAAAASAAQDGLPPAASPATPAEPVRRFGAYATFALSQVASTRTRQTYRSALRHFERLSPCDGSVADNHDVPDPGQAASCTEFGCSEAAHVRVWDVALAEVTNSIVMATARAARRAHRRAEARRDGVAVTDLRDKIGAGAYEGAVTAARYVCNTAVNNGILDASPVRERLRATRATRRRALSATEVTQVFEVASSTATDPELVELLMRFHLWTGARQAAALALRLQDLDVEAGRVELARKGSGTYTQQVPPVFVTELEAFARSRGAAAGTDHVFRNRRGQKISKRTHENVWRAVRTQLRFAEEIDASTHVLRKTAATLIDREFSQAVAEAFLGHAGANSVVWSYTQGQPEHVAEAVAWLTGLPHPLAPGQVG